MKSNFDYSLFYTPFSKKQIITRLSGIVISSSLKISETIKHGRLTYVNGEKPIAFICSKHETDYIELGFFKAIYLNDPNNLFKGKAKEIRRIRIRNIKDIPVIQIKRWVRESVRIF